MGTVSQTVQSSYAEQLERHSVSGIRYMVSPSKRSIPSLPLILPGWRKQYKPASQFPELLPGPSLRQPGKLSPTRQANLPPLEASTLAVQRSNPSGELSRWTAAQLHQLLKELTKPELPNQAKERRPLHFLPQPVSTYSAFSTYSTQKQVSRGTKKV